MERPRREESTRARGGCGRGRERIETGTEKRWTSNLVLFQQTIKKLGLRAVRLRQAEETWHLDAGAGGSLLWRTSEGEGAARRGEGCQDESCSLAAPPPFSALATKEDAPACCRSG